MLCSKCGEQMSEGQGVTTGYIENGQTYFFSEVKLACCSNPECNNTEVQTVGGDN